MLLLRSSVFNLLLTLWIVLLLPERAHAQTTCTEDCQNACAQGSFAACTVDCTNTVADSVNTCQAAIFENGSTVTCADGGCQNAQASGASDLTCTGDSSCLRLKANQSSVECLDNSCDEAQFTASAIYCEPYSSCGSSWKFACTW